MKNLLGYIKYMFLFMGTVVLLTSCGDDPEEVTNDNITQVLQEYKWVCRTSDEPLIDDDWIMLDDYVTMLYFVNSNECVVRYQRKTTDSSSGVSYTREAQTLKYHVTGNTITFENPLYSPAKLTYHGNYLADNSFVFEKDAITSYDYDWINENYEPSFSDDHTTPEESKDAQTIKNNVNASVTYTNYRTNIFITHTLPTLFPGKSIEFIIGHGVGGKSYSWVFDRPQPSVFTSGNTVTVTAEFPLFFYFITKVNEASTEAEKDEYKELWTNCEMCLTTYNDLMGKSSLSPDQKSLLDKVTKKLNSYEKMASGDYTIWIYAQVGESSVTIGSYDIYYGGLVIAHE